MKWVCWILVYLFSTILLISLLGTALATSGQISLTHPNKIENWLNQSNFYQNLETSIVNQAQSAIANDITGGGSISKTTVQQAIKSALPQSALKQYVQTVLNSNYAWLEGKTATPYFQINLYGAKQEFANKIANEAVLTHLSGLPTCTSAQTLQLESANPLLLSCLPTGVSPLFETSQVSQQIVSSNDFLSNPTITADTQKLDGKPYYKKLVNLPKDYRLIQKVPGILAIVSILSLLIIIFSARSKRLGLRFVSIAFLLSGIFLIAYKFTTDALFNTFKDHFFSNIISGQVQQSLISFAHYIELDISNINLRFGIAYIALAVVVFIILVLTRRHGSSRGGKPSIVTTQPAVSQKPASLDDINPNAKPSNTPLAPRVSPQSLKKRPPSKPPRLIQ